MQIRHFLKEYVILIYAKLKAGFISKPTLLFQQRQSVSSHEVGLPIKQMINAIFWARTPLGTDAPLLLVELRV